ncbi:MAG: murein L,D-transpeptidase catalytic domain family protein [Myxococcales bacterium]|nr:murein L,D-transpeptidase catalytic domain family protein [Myxococcales bacterium]
MTSFPFEHSSTTTGAASDQFDSYACGPQNESGPEVIYQVELTSPGFLWLELSGLPAGVDIDVHLLGSLDPNDCLDRGHWSVGDLLPAGQYYVTADTWVDGNGVPADGAYTLGIGLTTVQDLQGWGMDGGVAYDALHVFDRAWHDGLVETTAYAVVDFAVHAAQKRMWVFDVFDTSLRHHTYTTVGEASDPNADGFADSFSNLSGSHKSSLGLMKGAELYTGTYGPSMRLDGLEPGFNDNVRPRAIVVHSWTGSAPAYVATHPTSGAAPTWGCLGIDPGIVEDLRSFLAEGGLLLSHFPDGSWSQTSTFLP